MMPLNLSRCVKNFIVRNGPNDNVNPTRKKDISYHQEIEQKNDARK